VSFKDGGTFVVEQKLYRFVSLCMQLTLVLFTSKCDTDEGACFLNELESASARPHQADDRQDGDHDGWVRRALVLSCGGGREDQPAHVINQSPCYVLLSQHVTLPDRLLLCPHSNDRKLSLKIIIGDQKMD
jgi:hypothetical protein